MADEEDGHFTVYLDVCCLNRPFDDQTQDRIRLESEAVVLILQHILHDDWRWLSSEVINYEIGQMPDKVRELRINELLQSATDWVKLSDLDLARGQALELLGFSAYDALHLACAERGQADVFLTTDDRLMHLAKRNPDSLAIKVANPLAWLNEEAR